MRIKDRDAMMFS